MAKYPGLFFNLILFCLFPFNMEGQVQKNFPDLLADKFMKYCNSLPWEEIYVHTDRQDYIAGEEIWMKAYLIDRQSFKLSNESRIAYIEILNQENRPVLQKRIKLDFGSGPGQLVLPDTLSSGYYTMRAYTNWMKNFLPANCFTKRLKIINVINPGKIESNLHVISVPANSPAGTVQSSPSEQGVSIDIIDTNPGFVELVIRSGQNFRTRNGSSCYLFIHTHGVINSKRSFIISRDTTVIDVPRNLIDPGINHITIFNASGRPVAERFIFTKAGENSSIGISSPDNYKIREKITLEISTDKKSDREKNISDLSISVADAGTSRFPDIVDYMIFGSEFGSIPEEIMNTGISDLSSEVMEKFLSEIKSNWINWSLILSDELPVTKYAKETGYHFIYGRLLDRNTQVPDSNRFMFLSIPGKHATFQYARTDKNGEFSFNIPPDDKIRDLIIQPEEVEIKNNIKIETSFSDRYPDIKPAMDTSIRTEPRSISKLGINYQVMKIYQSDEVPLKLDPVSFTGGSERFYGKPDIELVMDDYIKLPVIQEVFFELMPGVFLKKKKSEYEITIMDPVESKIYDHPPVLFVDGVVVKDPDIIASLDPEKVEKIDAVKSRYFVGNYLFYGLVNVITRAGDLSDITLPDYAVRLTYRVTEPVKSFTSPEYSSAVNKQNRIPDFRNTLFWNPSLKTDEEGRANVEFWSSDFKSDFEINIQGFTVDGSPVSLRKAIKVQ